MARVTWLQRRASTDRPARCSSSPAGRSDRRRSSSARTNAVSRQLQTRTHRGDFENWFAQRPVLGRRHRPACASGRHRGLRRGAAALPRARVGDLPLHLDPGGRPDSFRAHHVRPARRLRHRGEPAYSASCSVGMPIPSRSSASRASGSRVCSTDRSSRSPPGRCSPLSSARFSGR